MCLNRICLSLILILSGINAGFSQHKLYLKTNLLPYGAAIVNVGAEIDIVPHLSFNLPIYYSAWDYFKQTTKFRTFAIQPEFRYWPKCDHDGNNGFFAGAHFGLAYYNLAFGGAFRYQDHKSKIPAIGGGISAGYRFPLNSNKRLGMEISLGAGIYHASYDKFDKTPKTSEGMLTGHFKKTYYGVDQANLSLTYSFDINKKGGKK